MIYNQDPDETIEAMSAERKARQEAARQMKMKRQAAETEKAATATEGLAPLLGGIIGAIAAGVASGGMGAPAGFAAGSAIGGAVGQAGGAVIRKDAAGAVKGVANTAKAVGSTKMAYDKANPEPQSEPKPEDKAKKF